MASQSLNDGPVVIRPVALADRDALLGLAELAGVGLTTLPKDEGLLVQRINKSIKSFERIPSAPGGESYLLVMETGQGKVIGACGVVSKVGGFQPFYSYKIESQLFESPQIGVRKEVPLLRLVEDHDGPCEIGSLFLHPDFRGHNNGRLLQLVRFLLIGEYRPAFESTVVSEIRGVLDDQGRSPFWDAVGRHFFGIEFAEADRLSVVNKRFIADLMPDHPIYTPLLPKSAQDVIGVAHDQSRPAVKNLEREGFKFAKEVDIFDAGPVLACHVDQIRSVREAKKMPFGGTFPPENAEPVCMVGQFSETFRATRCVVQERGGQVFLPPVAAAALRVRIGDLVRFVTLRPEVSGGPEEVST
jgi:arginine N-succinyltransferase